MERRASSRTALQVLCGLLLVAPAVSVRIFQPSTPALPVLARLVATRGGSQFPQPSDVPVGMYDPNVPVQGSASTPADPFHETTQDRVDEWRTHQREQAAAVQDSPRDEKGRLKLLTSVSKGSRALIFFVLMWRNVHLYEIADQTRTGLARLFLVVPLTILFIANMAGAVASLTSPSHSAKKRLKAILNLDKVLEVFLLLFYFVRLTILPSKYTPREIYISNTLHSVFFILQCQAFTRLSWDDSAGAPMGSSYPPNEANTGQQPQPQQQRQDGWANTQPPPQFGQRTL